MAVQLERAPLKKTAEGLADEQVLKDIREVLGYQLVDKEITYSKVVTILETLGIEPLDRAKVREYKEEQVRVHSTVVQREWGQRVVRKALWKDYLLSDYTRQVPIFALLRAAEVKKALDAAHIESTIYVEELTVKETVVDPFLFLYVVGKRIYLDVWEEPKFEGRRTK